MAIINTEHCEEVIEKIVKQRRGETDVFGEIIFSATDRQSYIDGYMDGIEALANYFAGYWDENEFEFPIELD